MASAKYSYPTTERTTDELETSVDPWKLLRETSLIECMFCFDWSTCLDFGTGTGRHLTTIARTQSGRNQNCRIVAYDPDINRIGLAKRTKIDCPTEYLSGSLAAIDADIESSSLDAILCCQVLGHVSVDAFAEIMKFFEDKLKRRGVLIVCIPFCHAGHRRDFFHMVDMNIDNRTASDFRTPLSASNFSAKAESPEQGFLPVRAFKVSLPNDLNGNQCLPFSCNAPVSLENAANFTVTSSMVYSVHAWDDMQRPIIGDIIVKLRRR